MSDVRYRLLKVICGICILNFVVFCIVAFESGGDAVNGKIMGGHFYLAENGKLTEVSEALFTYSLWHVRSLAITWPLAMLAGYLLKMENRERRRRAGLPPYYEIRTP